MAENTPSNNVQILNLELLKEAVAKAAAIRLVAKLQPAGGSGDKVFPPTYAGGVYAVEDRRIDGRVVRCALLDSVQSQANRMEEALLDAFLPNWRTLQPAPNNETTCGLPIMAVRVHNHGWITSLTAPHRVHDAILRDSEIEQVSNTDKQKKERVRFRDSTIGEEIVAARLHDATALYKHCPTALIFGTWDSTAGEGLDSAKIPRAIVSEIMGVDITPGIRTASRIDPLGIRAQSATVYRLQGHEYDWTIEESKAGKNAKGETKRFGKGKPSDINHGNVTPDMPRFDKQEIQKQKLDRLPDLLETAPLQLHYELTSGDGRIDTHGSFRSDEVRIRPGAVKPGGVTMDYALHTWTLSFTQLRRLRFPPHPLPSEQSGASGNADASKTEGQAQAKPDDRDRAARTVLAALALYALALLQERGYWLRSRCELVPSESIVLSLVGGPGGEYSLGSSADVKEKILDVALGEAEGRGVAWWRTVTLLEPTAALKQLVVQSDRLGPEPEPGEEQTDAGAEG